MRETLYSMKKFLVITFVILTTAVLAFAQTSTGRLSGVVSSPDGVLRGATITATDNNTGRSQTVTSGGEGAFLFPQFGRADRYIDDKGQTKILTVPNRF